MVVKYVPAAQSVHTAEPVAILYLPATQAVHVPPFGPVKPTLHVQAASAELEIGELELVGHARQAVASVAPTVVEYVPAAQSVHTAEPVAILYLPATQAVHVPPSWHPVTCTSPKLKIRLVPNIIIWRYRPRTGCVHVTSVM